MIASRFAPAMLLMVSVFSIRAQTITVSKDIRFTLVAVAKYYQIIPIKIV
jgi:hypothetical protein